MSITAIIILSVAIALAMLGVTTKVSSDWEGNWKSFARDHGLQYGNSGKFSLTGECRGVRMDVEVEKRGNNSNPRKYTVFRASLPEEVPVDFELYPESLGSKIGGAFGTQDIEIGHDEIDDAFVIRSSYPDEVKRFFDRESVRTAFIQLNRRLGAGHIEYGELILEQSGLIGSRERLETLVMELVDFSNALADCMEESAQEPSTNAAPSGEHVAEW